MEEMQFRPYILKSLVTPSVCGPARKLDYSENKVSSTVENDQ